MKKRFSAAAILAAVLMAVCCFLPAYAGPGPYVRSEAVSPDEKKSEKRNKAISEKAWKRINGVCYNGSGEPIPGAVTRGIDVSEWQGVIDWSKVKKSDVDFAIIRLSHGLKYTDKYYDYNMKNATANNIPVGIYVYSTATNTKEALREAQYAITKVQGYKISYPIVYDIEDSSAESLTNSARSDLAVAFCKEIKKAGYYPMVYFNLWWYRTMMDMSKLKSYDVWLASFGDTINKPDTDTYRYTIWQCTGGDTTPGMNSTRGLIDGIPKENNTDLDFGFVDYTKKITPRTMALSGYTPEPAMKDGWVTEDGKTYYYKNGKKLTGAQRIGEHEYRFSTADGHLFTDTLLYSKTTRNVVYCSSSGALVKNRWVTWAGKKYYIGDDYLAYKGSRNVGGKFYWFNGDRGYMMRSAKLLTTKGDVYYYGPDGVRVTSGFTQIKEDGKINTYYFNKQGLGYKGWHKINGKDYWFYGGKSSKTGVRAENVTLKIGNYTCTFDKNGVCVSRTEA